MLKSLAPRLRSSPSGVRVRSLSSVSGQDITDHAQASNRTHEVFNQVPVLEGFNFFEADLTLQDCCKLWADSNFQTVLGNWGSVLGSAQMQSAAFQANRFTPEFKPFDSRGNRVDEVEYHPAYHYLIAQGIKHRVPSYAWANQGKQGAFVTRAALQTMYNGVEPGVNCPLTMTFACVPTLKKQDSIAESWLPKVTSDVYDHQMAPVASKQGALVGMSMTEKQGGSDVRANTTVATPINSTQGGELYSLKGHKWFTSAPMCDGFLTLAKTEVTQPGSREGALSCFLVPRVLPDGTKNSGFQIQRLKNKLGDRSNASSEVEYHGALGFLIGSEGKGVANIMDMVTLTRLDCALGSNGLMRSALMSAAHHASNRNAWGQTLIEQPAMTAVLADLECEVSASTWMVMRTAQSFEDARSGDPQALAFNRIVTAITKYFVTKRCTPVVVEAMECHGGNGFVEEHIMPRLFRQSPLNSIWEGSGNVICMDVLRAMRKDDATVGAVFQEVDSVQGLDASYDRFVADLKDSLMGAAREGNEGLQANARHLIDRLALAIQGAVLLRNCPDTLLVQHWMSTHIRGEFATHFGTGTGGSQSDRLHLARRAVPLKVRE